MKRAAIFALLALAAIVSGCIGQPAEEYNPQINPSEFSTEITNKYFSLPGGKTMTYEGTSEEGKERIVVIATNLTRNIMGVETLVYWDRVWLNDELIEDTRDYLAQDSSGNLWYFGENVDNYENGQLKDHSGSWIAGVDGAKPGIWMKADPKIGETYRQEYYVGEAEDMADVISLNETVIIDNKTYTNCLKTYDYTPLDPDSKENKYYCPEVAGMILEENILTGERVELVSVDTA